MSVSLSLLPLFIWEVACCMEMPPLLLGSECCPDQIAAHIRTEHVTTLY